MPRPPVTGAFGVSEAEAEADDLVRLAPDQIEEP